jgi:hypothetical protein
MEIARPKLEPPKVDSVALQHLVDMGFPETPATKALILNR